MAGHGEKLTRKQEVAIANLLTATNLTAAAEQTGVSERTLIRWLQKEGFQDAYREARRQVVQHAVVQIQQACEEAVSTLRQIMTETGLPASARVSAARAVLDSAFKAVELEDLEVRLQRLEAGRPEV